MSIDHEMTAESFPLFAYKYYNNPQCVDIEEFYDDLKRFKYLKKLLNRYQETGKFSERLILNHVITIYNLFGIDASNQMIRYKFDEIHWPALNSCLAYLGYINKKETTKTDPRVMEILEKI